MGARGPDHGRGRARDGDARISRASRDGDRGRRRRRREPVRAAPARDRARAARSACTSRAAWRRRRAGARGPRSTTATLVVPSRAAVGPTRARARTPVPGCADQARLARLGAHGRRRDAARVLEEERERGLALFAERPPTSRSSRPRRPRCMGRKARFGEVQRVARLAVGADDRRRVGQAANEVRAALQAASTTGAPLLERAAEDALLEADRLDLTLPGRRPRRGSLHPLDARRARDRRRLHSAWASAWPKGPEIEDDWHNFQALNIPPDHPARTMKDSPLRGRPRATPSCCCAPRPRPCRSARCSRSRRRSTSWRRAACTGGRRPTPRTSPVFHQVEGLAVDEGITFADLKGTLEAFAKALFGEDRRVRLGPAYFPFVEPGAEVGVSCFVCDGVGLPRLRQRLDRAARRGHGAPAGPRELRVRHRALHGLRVRASGIERVALLRYGDPRHPPARRGRRAVPRAVRGRRHEGRPAPGCASSRPTDLAADELAELLTRTGVKIEGVLRPWAGLDGRRRRAGRWRSRDHPDSDKLCRRAGRRRRRASTRSWSASATWRRATSCRGRGPGSRVPVAARAARARARSAASSPTACSARRASSRSPHDHEGILLLNDEGLEPGDRLEAALGLDDAVLDIEVEPNRPDFLSRVRRRARGRGGHGRPAASRPTSTVRGGRRARRRRGHRRARRRRRLPALPRARDPRRRRPAPSPLRVQARLTACGHAADLARSSTRRTTRCSSSASRCTRSTSIGSRARASSCAARADGERLRDARRRRARAHRGGPADLRRWSGRWRSPASWAAPPPRSPTPPIDVLLESAYFTRAGVLRTARRLDLHSEASHRFERGTDPEAPRPGAAARRAADRRVERAAGSSRASPRPARRPPRRWVSMRPARASALLGYDVSAPTTRRRSSTAAMAHRRVAGRRPCSRSRSPATGWTSSARST